MLIFIGEGRLGNQVFQLRYLRSARAPGETIVAVGLESTADIFELEPGIRIIRLGKWGKRIVRHLLLALVLRPLAANLRLINYATEVPASCGDGTDGSGLANVRTGLFARLTLVDGGYYQAARHWPAVLPADDFRIRPARQAVADALYRQVGSGQPCAFVHVRRGDYTQWSAYGQSDLALPATYYLAGIREILALAPEARIAFVTDDPAWVREHLAPACPGSTVVAGTEADDFCFMRACDAGVISNSTFSLAAALLMYRAEIIVGPRHWLGFRSAEWLPPGIEFSNARIRYIAVGSS